MSLKKVLCFFIAAAGAVSAQFVLAADPSFSSSRVNVNVTNSGYETLSLQSADCSNICVLEAPISTVLKAGATVTYQVTGNPGSNIYFPYTITFIFATTSSMGGKVGCSLTVTCQSGKIGDSPYCQTVTATASPYTSGSYSPNWLPNCNQRPSVINADTANDYLAQVNYSILPAPTQKK